MIKKINFAPACFFSNFNFNLGVIPIYLQHKVGRKKLKSDNGSSKASMARFLELDFTA